MASEARFRLGLDEVYLMVANIPWQKADREVTQAVIRVEMCRAAVEGHDGFVVSTDEVDRGGATYTAETLRRIHERDNPDEIVLIMGSDTALGLSTWVEPETVATLATLGIVNRPGTELAELDPIWRYRSISAPLIDISSSAIRARVGAGEPIDFMVPDAVDTIIGRHGLYCGAQ